MTAISASRCGGEGEGAEIRGWSSSHQSLRMLFFFWEGRRRSLCIIIELIIELITHHHSSSHLGCRQATSIMAPFGEGWVLTLQKGGQ